jgi:hypothetical protein
MLQNGESGELLPAVGREYHVLPAPNKRTELSI